MCNRIQDTTITFFANDSGMKSCYLFLLLQYARAPPSIESFLKRIQTNMHMTSIGCYHKIIYQVSMTLRHRVMKRGTRELTLQHPSLASEKEV